MRAWVIVNFMVYPLTAYVVLSAFAIDKSDDPEATSFDESKKVIKLLRADPSERGEGEKYDAWCLYASFCTLTHVIGIPISYAVALFRKRHILDPADATGHKPRIDPDDRRSTRQVVDAVAAGRDHDVSVANTRPLWSVYRPAYYQWEIVESLRRMAFTSVPLLVSSNKTPASLSAFVVVALALCSTLVYREHRPFLQESDDNLYEGCQWTILVLSLLIFARTTSAMDSAGTTLDVLLVLTIPTLLGITLYVVFRDLSNERRAIEILRHELSHARETFQHKVRPTFRLSVTATTSPRVVLEEVLGPRSAGGPVGRPAEKAPDERDDILLVRDSDSEDVVVEFEQQQHDSSSLASTRNR